MKASPRLHHPISSFGVVKIADGGIRVDRLQDRLVPKVPFPHRHDFFHLLVISAGSGWHEIDFVRHKVRPRQIFLMKPGQVHSWSLGRGIRGYVIEFTRESLALNLKNNPDLFFRLSGSLDSLSPPAVDFRAIETVCSVMQDELLKQDSGFEAALQGFLYGFLIQILRASERRQPLREGALTQDLVARFQNLVEESFTREHEVAGYARRLNVTVKALNAKTNRVLGKSPRLVIQERLILEAKRLLAYSSLTVAEVGYELGFEDANYFARYFRLSSSLSPSEFRAEAKSL